MVPSQVRRTAKRPFSRNILSRARCWSLSKSAHVLIAPRIRTLCPTAPKCLRGHARDLAIAVAPYNQLAEANGEPHLETTRIPRTPSITFAGESQPSCFSSVSRRTRGAGAVLRDDGRRSRHDQGRSTTTGCSRGISSSTYTGESIKIRGEEPPDDLTRSNSATGSSIVVPMCCVLTRGVHDREPNGTHHQSTRFCRDTSSSWPSISSSLCRGSGSTCSSRTSIWSIPTRRTRRRDPGGPADGRASARPGGAGMPNRDWLKITFSASVGHDRRVFKGSLAILDSVLVDRTAVAWCRFSLMLRVRARRTSHPASCRS